MNGFFLLKTRNTSSGIRFAKVRVNNTNGLLILPDCWSDSNYPLVNTNKENVSYDSNIIDLTTWEELFAAQGVVFLPAGGDRTETNINDSGVFGGYWSATPTHNHWAYGMYFNEINVWCCDLTDRYVGYSVRLVCGNN